MKAQKVFHSCRSQNNLIFSNCEFCNALLPLDENSYTNKHLVTKANEWISKSKELLIQIKGPNSIVYTGWYISTFKEQK